MGIDCDLYGLKHLNTTRNVSRAFAMLKEAQEQAAQITAHKSTAMIAKVYDIDSNQRLNEDLRKTSKGFV